MSNEPIHFRPTDKTKTYLEEMKFLNKQTGKTTRNSLNLSEFLNACVVYCCELAKPPAESRASGEELERAWKKIQIAKRQQKIQDLRDEINTIAGFNDRDFESVGEKKKAYEKVVEGVMGDE